MRIPTETEIAYVAGLFDGEGCVSIYYQAEPKNGKVYHNINVRLSNTHEGVLRWVQERFGGALYVNQPGGKGGHRPGFVLQWANKAIPAFLEQMLPYLIIKREAAEIALAFRLLKKNPGRNGLDPSVVEKREELRQRLIAINGYKVKERKEA
jgi:hypothetical protein